MYAVLVVKLTQFEETKVVFRCNKSKNDKNSLSDNPMHMLKNLKYSSRKVIDMLGWLGIKIMCRVGRHVYLRTAVSVRWHSKINPTKYVNLE